MLECSLSKSLAVLLIARMPLICAKSHRIQNHNTTSDELEMLDRLAQFETGLTGTPYATGRSIYWCK
jgi:hypothetical protein